MRLTPPLFFLLAVLLGACQRPPDTRHHALFVFGTLIEITLSGVDQRSAETLFNELESDFHRWHAQWTPWQDSDLRRTNSALQRGEEILLPASIAPLVRHSQALYIKSDGLFNPAIGKLIKLWRFHQFDQPSIQPPDASHIAELVRSNPRITDIQWRGQHARSTNPDVDLNFGAYAKGYAIDLAMQALREHGVYNAVINAGGDLSVIGRIGERTWRIGIRHPRTDGLIASLDALPGDSIFTSGDYERFYIHKGKRYHHILDPRTGYPAAGVRSVTVIDDDAALADAAATALFVAGVKDWQRIAHQLGIEYVMLIDDQGQVHMNPKMAARIRFEIDPPPPTIISEPL